MAQLTTHIVTVESLARRDARRVRSISYMDALHTLEAPYTLNRVPELPRFAAPMIPVFQWLGSGQRLDSGRKAPHSTFDIIVALWTLSIDMSTARLIEEGSYCPEIARGRWAFAGLERVGCQ